MSGLNLGEHGRIRERRTPTRRGFTTSWFLDFRGTPGVPESERYLTTDLGSRFRSRAAADETLASVREHAEEHGDWRAAIDRRRTPKRRRYLHLRGAGFREIDRHGYIRVYAPAYPWPRKNSMVREHVAVMELHIGRRLKPDEVVHHRNHDTQDNRIENLELMARGEHARRHLDSDGRPRSNGRWVRRATGDKGNPMKDWPTVEQRISPEDFAEVTRFRYYLRLVNGHAGPSPNLAHLRPLQRAWAVQYAAGQTARPRRSRAAS